MRRRKIKLSTQLYLDAGPAVDLWLLLLQAQLVHILLHSEFAKFAAFYVGPNILTFFNCLVAQLIYPCCYALISFFLSLR